jgi:uncharacterized protein (DUF1501 family)
MDMKRRKFLLQTAGMSAASMVGTLSRLGTEAANAQAAAAPYQALVAVFLYGGNDANNMIIPVTNYAQYATVRTAASNVAIPQANLLNFTAASQGGATYGFHPSLGPLQQLYTQGKLAILANVGELIAPITMAQYKAGTNRPFQLFSHADQQDAWQGLLVGKAPRTGWGGRMADKLIALNAGQQIPTIVSLQGQATFNTGYKTVALSIPTNGGVAVAGQAADPVSTARFNAMSALLNTGSSNQLVTNAATVMQGSLAANAAVNPILSAALPAVIQNAFTFNGAQLNTGLAQQLKQVARIIEARAALGMTRQVFIVQQGGYDTHSNTVNNQTNLFNTLAPALNAFYQYTVAAGISTQVTTFTMSDFNRTFLGNGNAGVDHAWGSHHFVIGGAVKGGDMTGTFPQLVLKGPDDVGGQGLWLPTTAVDQMGSTLAKWFGVADVDVDYMFPNLNNFSTRYLTFI